MALLYLDILQKQVGEAPQTCFCALYLTITKASGSDSDCDRVQTWRRRVALCNSPLGSGLNGLFSHQPFLVIQRLSQRSQHSSPEGQNLQTSRRNAALSKASLTDGSDNSVNAVNSQHRMNETEATFKEETCWGLYLVCGEQRDGADALQRGHPDALKERREEKRASVNQVHSWMLLVQKKEKKKIRCIAFLPIGNFIQTMQRRCTHSLKR